MTTAAGRVRHHAIIAGTGRAGTSFIVQLLSRLGLDTGYDALFPFNDAAKAGLEYDIRKDDAPYIVKNPAISSYIDDILANDRIVIDHAFIPIRDLAAAARSRIEVQERSGVAKPVPGGLVFTQDRERQAEVLAGLFHNLVLALTRADIPMTFISYPRLTADCDYLYHKLKPLLADVSRDRFGEAFDALRRPDWVHSFTANDR